MRSTSHYTFALSEIVEAITPLFVRSPQIEQKKLWSQKCTEISTDTRNMNKQSCFVPLMGENFNGHDFIASAIDKGSNTVIYSQKLSDTLLQQAADKNVSLLHVTDTLLAYQYIARFYRDHLRAKVIGITGSTGKTTTRNMIVQILSMSHSVHTNTKNFNNMVGVPKTILECPPNTDYLVLEMGINQPGEMEKLSYTGHPDIALILNVHPAHLEFLKTYQNVISEKAKIFNHLKNMHAAVIPSDNRDLYSLVCQKGLKPYTFSHLAATSLDKIETDVTLKEYSVEKTSADTVTILCQTAGRDLQIRLHSFGMQFIIDAIAAIAVTLKAEVSESDIITGLEAFRPVEGRFHQIITRPFILIDDTYNANVQSMKAAIEAVSTFFASNRKILVLADMKELGSFSDNAHIEIGKTIQSSTCDILVTYGDNAKIISDTAMQNGFSAKNIYHSPSHKETLDFLKRHLKENDCVLIKGSHSMKMDTIISELRSHAFDNDNLRK